MKANRLLERIPESRFVRPWLTSELLEASTSKVVYQEGSLRVKLYPAHEAPARGQVLLFPSLINRPYVLDLGRGRSLIQAMVQQGLEVVVFDWGAPTTHERDLGLQALLQGRIPRALRAVHAYSELESHDRRPRTLMGHCLGGNLALLFAASLESNRGLLKIDRLICLTTPIETSNDALLNTWFQTPEWDTEQFARSFQNIPWPLLQFSFQMQRPTLTAKRWIQLAQHLTEKDFRDSWLQMEIWSNDCISFSSELFRDLLIPMYRDNAFFNPPPSGPWKDVGRLKLPVFSIAALDDHIVPRESARAILDLLPHAQHEFREMKGGHIGAVISKRTRETLWPEMMTFLTSSARKACRTGLKPRANPSRKSAVKGVAALTQVKSRGPQGCAENLGAHQN